MLEGVDGLDVFLFDPGKHRIAVVTLVLLVLCIDHNLEG